jgi:hypothetical protein
VHNAACAGIGDGTLVELAALLGKALGAVTIVGLLRPACP